MGRVFTQLNQTIKRRMQSKGWTVEREDEKTIQFIFGAVRFTHTLMHDSMGTRIILLMSGLDLENISDIVL